MFSPEGTESEESLAEEQMIIGARKAFLNKERRLGLPCEDVLRKIRVLEESSLELEMEGGGE